MKDLHRVSVIAIVFLVLLRIAIGWQFLYEGLWKRTTMKSADPWTSEGYLKNAQGPFRNFFRNMTGDPDDLLWLDYSAMSKKWYDWRNQFVSHYDLSDEQRDQLNRLLDGSAEHDSGPDQPPPAIELRQTLTALPASVEGKKLPESVKYVQGEKGGILIASAPILPSEEIALLSMVDVARNADGNYGKRSNPDEAPDGVELEFFNAVNRLVTLSRNLSYRHKLAAALRGNPENAGVTGSLNERGSFDFIMGTVTPDQVSAEKHVVSYGKIQEYKDLVADYNHAVETARLDFQNEHATRLGRKLASMRNDLVGPIRTLESSLKESALKLLSPEQLRRGVLPAPSSPLMKADQQVMWALIIIGTLLIVGLGTRVAAVVGAGLVLSFYLVMPPWPGVPPIAGPEHSFIVNKNLIEVIALLAIAFLPTGEWFGLDSLCNILSRRKKSDSPIAQAKKP